MTAYYNEIDPYAAQWLRNLINAGHIAPGIVDERSIEDVYPSDLRGFTQCHFFAGIGVWSHALRLAGWSDDRPVWTGSCPCQPFSKAGKGAGFADERHLWPAWQWLIKECRPLRILGEQVPDAVNKGWLDLASTDLEALGYAVGAFRFRSSDVGEPISRRRLYFAAAPKHICPGMAGQRASADPSQIGQRRWRGEEDLLAIAAAPFERGDRWPEPLVRRVDHELAACVGPLHAIGNAINAAAAQAFIECVMDA
jgi:DNA (cytosine-5)-methyltransferase 1